MRGSCSTASLTRPDKRFSAGSLGQVLFGDLGFAADCSFVVAYSGGLDSHSLLHALAALRAVTPLRLLAVHVDHGLQAASTEWSRHCLQVCAGLEVPCRVERLEVRPLRGEGLEAAARDARYAALARHLSGDAVLVTGHHQDDQAETVLLQLLRGGGVHGLAGMPQVAPFASGRMARPLLGFSRAALRTYALDQGLAWIEDPSNIDPRYRRNRLRQELIPQLEMYWPSVQAVLARSAVHASETAQLLDEVGALDLDRCLARDIRDTCGQRRSAPLSVTALTVLSPARRRNVLRYWMRTEGFLAPSAAHLEEIERQLAHQPVSRHARITWPQTEIWRYRDELHLMVPMAAMAADLELGWDLRAPLVIPGTGCRLRPMQAWGRGLALERLAGRAVQVRLRRGGESCRLPGRAHHQKLKKLLQARGIEPWLRDRLPLVYVDGELAAAADLWVCEPYAARAEEPAVVFVWEHC